MSSAEIFTQHAKCYLVWGVYKIVIEKQIHYNTQNYTKLKLIQSTQCFSCPKIYFTIQIEEQKTKKKDTFQNTFDPGYSKTNSMSYPTREEF